VNRHVFSEDVLIAQVRTPPLPSPHDAEGGGALPRKALESHCPTVELAEAEHASLQMLLISSTALEQLIDKLEHP